ncbi:MAG: ABC transporter permease [Candidatus Binataceae bacterium]
MAPSVQTLQQAQVSFGHLSDATLQVRLSGSWRLRHGLPSPSKVDEAIQSPPQSKHVSFDASGLGEWDSSLLTFVTRVIGLCQQRGLTADLANLPDGLQRMVQLAAAVPEREGAHQAETHPGFVERLGRATIALWDGGRDFLAFFGEVMFALGRFVTGRARYRRIDFALVIQECGADAFPIVTLIAFLVGSILAFMGAVQLQRFGASIYVADLVGIAIARDMGAMMTAIIMAGRTGAAFAAQLGTMKVTQEIDALTTMGISPMDFLVLPRVVGLVVMMPLLCLYSDFVGFLGGAAVGVGLLDLSFLTYMRETAQAVSLADIGGGILKATVYGIIIAVAGCLRGFECGNSSSAVGEAATRAVVTGIVFVVVACGVFAFIFSELGI